MMSPAELVRQLLVDVPGTSLCDSCLALTCRIALSEVRQVTQTLIVQDTFQPGSACTSCRRRVSTIVYRATWAPAAMDEATDALLRELRKSPTDLAKLVRRIHQRHRQHVAVSAAALARWTNEDPHAWDRVRAWLTQRGVRVVVR